MKICFGGENSNNFDDNLDYEYDDNEDVSDDDDDDDVVDAHLLGADNLNRKSKDHHEDSLGPDSSQESVS